MWVLPSLFLFHTLRRGVQKLRIISKSNEHESFRVHNNYCAMDIFFFFFFFLLKAHTLQYGGETEQGREQTIKQNQDKINNRE